MATIRRVAQFFGVGFLILGGAGLYYVRSLDDGMLWGLFPVNLVLNLVHVLFGAWGLAAAATFSGAKSYCQIVGIVCLVLAGAGHLTPTVLGIMPIGGNDALLHAGLGLILAYAGFIAKEGAGMTAR
jgi:hypothetical protein